MEPLLRGYTGMYRAQGKGSGIYRGYFRLHFHRMGVPFKRIYGAVYGLGPKNTEYYFNN